MAYDNRDSIDFATLPVGKLFRRMFIPTLLGMVSGVVLNITDGAFVGHGVGSDALAAVNIVAPVYMLITGIGLMFGIGGSVVASVHLSKGEVKPARINITQSYIGGLVAGSLLAAIILSFPETVCRLFGANDALVPLATKYLFWIALFQPFCMIAETGLFALRLDGQPRLAAGVHIATAALNIFLDWLLIFPLHMGLEGAAIATAFCYGLCGIICLGYNAFFAKTLRLYALKLSSTSLMLTLRNLAYQVRLGFSAFIGEIALSVLFIVGNYQFIRFLGEDGVAAFSVACYCMPITFMVANSITQSAQPIISFGHGQNVPERVLEAARISLFAAVGGGLAIVMVMAVGAPQIASIFLPAGCAAHDICAAGLPLFAISALFTIVNVVCVGYYQSIERATRATVYTLLRGFVFMLPAFLLLPMLAVPEGLWLALPLAEFLTTLVILIMTLKPSKKG
ncbi:MAG: MATE family efflux transporter [Bacteroidales bacterium]|nr:MATE family efflux transporter [Bacteroidales bacterium]